MRLNTVRLVLPPFPTWENQLENNLDLESGEDARSVDFRVELRLPGPMILDYDRAAIAAGWTLGQLLSYLVAMGAVKVVEDAKKREGGDGPHA